MKDQRYKAIKSLIENNGLSGLKEVFTILPLTVVREDMKVNYNTLRRKVGVSDSLTVKDIRSLAELFEVESTEVLKLILKDIAKKEKTKEKAAKRYS